MPQNLDFPLYFNILFFSVMGIGFLIGYIRGYKKTLFALIASLIFYAFFFVTIDVVIDQLWILPIPFAFDYLASMVPDLAGQTTVGGAVFSMLETYVGDQIGDTLSNTMFVAFVTGLAQFVLKLVYTILYFTIGQILYKWLVFMLRLLVVRTKRAKVDKVKGKKGKRVKLSKKQKKLQKKEHNQELKENKKLRLKEKKPLLGAVFGIAKGAVSAFVSLIVIGGMLNMSESLLAVISDDADANAIVYEDTLYLSAYYHEHSTSPTELETGLPVPAELDAQITQARDMVDAFNANIFVQSASTIVVTSPEYADPIEMHLYLFDAVFSFSIEDDKVMLRNEINVFAEAGAIMLNSEFMETQDISDITSEEIVEIFTQISKSNLITTLVPLGIEVGSDYFDIPVEMPIEELYAIDWESEIMTLGAVVAVGFDLVNTAGLLDDSADLETITIDGDEVASLFNSLAESELVTLAAYVAIGPLLEEMGGEISAIITVPTDLVWEDEFVAFGQVAKAVLDTGITVGDLQDADPAVLISALAEMDFTVLLSSQIVSHALKNIFSGEAGIEGLDMIIVPDDIVWFDIFDDEGNLVTPGELRNILLAVNAITEVAGGFDFNNLDFNIISEFTDEIIDTIFDSQILVASISGFILDMDLGDTPLIIPDSVLDSNRYILSAELKAIASAAVVLVEDLACDEGDTVCEETGFDIAKAFSLEDDSIDTLLSSDILAVTIGQLIIDSGGDMLVIPNSALTEIFVDTVGQDVASREEIKKLFQAVSVLGFDDLDNMEFDASIVQNLGEFDDLTTLDKSKSDKLFGSKIVHATLSKMLFDQTEGVDSVLAVPYFDVDLNVIREYSVEDEIEYLSLGELEDILQAFLTLDITDFETVDALDLGLIIDNSAILLESAILHATISKQVFDLGSDVVAVPYKDELANAIRVTVGDVLEETDTEYIVKSEIINILDGLEVLDIDDITSFDGNIDLASITEDPANIDTLLDSAIIHATVSDQLIKLDTDGTIKIPYKDSTGTPIRVTVGDVGFETEYITSTEIKAMVDSLDILGATDMDSFDGNVDLASITEDPANIDTLLSSGILHATISDQLIQLDTDGTLAIPYKDAGVVDIRVTVGDVGFETEYIIKDEIKAIVDALDILGIEDMDSFDGNVDLASITEEPGNIDTLLLSAILHATISDQLIQLDIDESINIPYVEEDNATAVRVTIGDVGFETEYVTKDEIKAMVDALDILGIEDMDSFDGTVDLASITEEPGNMDIMLSSAIIHATVSDQLIELNDDGSILVPYVEEDNTTLVRVVVGAVGFTTEYVTKDEINAMIDALDILGIVDIESFDGTVDLETITAVDGNVDIMLASAIIHGTLSEQLIELDVDETILVPHLEEDNATLVRVTVGNPGFETEYITKVEINAMIDALDVLEITDVESFSGTVDLGLLMIDDNMTVVLSSAILQATISKQLIDLDTDGTINLPFLQEDNATQVRFTVGALTTETEYVLKAELEAMIDAMDILQITDIETFSGSVDLSLLMVGDNMATVLASAMIQATISEQLIDLDTDGTINLPYYKEDDVTKVRITVGALVTETEYVSQAELVAMIDAMDVLEITDIETFSGSVDLSVLAAGTNSEIVLSSAIIQATVSEQVLDLTTDPNMAATFIVPFWGSDDLTKIRISVGDALLFTDTDYILADELSAMIDGLDILGITDVETFDGSIDLSGFYDETNRNILLSSAIMQATISFQLIDLGDGVLLIPIQDVDTNEVRVTVGVVLETTEYVTKDEIGAMFEALEVLGFTDINNFEGTIDLNNVYGSANQDIILGSAAMHATISKQMSDLGPSVLYIPDTDILNVSIKATVLTTEFIEKVEIKAMINALEVLGITDINSFDGVFDLSVLSTDIAQTTLLSSAAIHATITKTMLDLDDAVLIVPAYSQTGESLGNEIRLTVSGFEFVIKPEIKALINAFNEMGYGDLDSFGAGLDSSEFFSGRAVLLLSSSIQATLSDKMLNDTGGELVVPDDNINTVTTIRLVHSDVTYIEINEMNAILNALDELGLTDFSTMAFEITNIFTVDYDLLFTSASIQATVSANILPNALDETAPAGSSTIIIPTYFRENIAVDGTPEKHIEKVELKALLDALEVLGAGDFGGGMDAGVITSLSDTDLDTMLTSGSVHTTIDNMMRGNTNINTEIPDLALADPEKLYKANLVSKVEIKAFIKATQTVALGSFTTVQFNVALLAGLNPAEQDIVADSMIVRNILTPNLVAGAPLKPYTITNADYMNNDPATFLTKATVLLLVQ